MQFSFFRSLVVAFICESLLLSTMPASAQSTADLSALKGLSQEQQDALAQSLLGRTDASGRKIDPKLNSPQTILPKNGQLDDPLGLYGKTRDGRTLRQGDEDPELRPEDTVLIDLTPIDIENKDDQGNFAPNNAGGNLNTAPLVNGVAPTETAGASARGLESALSGAAAQAGAGNNPQSYDNRPNIDKAFNDYGRITTRVPVRTDEQKKKISTLREEILKNNPYQLNRFGVLELPGLPAVPMAGLTAQEATNRLSADPDLRAFKVKITLLRLQTFDDEALKPFGYDLFEGAPTTFAPVSDIQVPFDYVIGPGDSLNVQLYGNEPETYTLTVGRDGRVNFPRLGPIMVSGMSFDQAREALEQRVTQQLIGSRISVTMADLRSIRVFVLGEAEKPGSYTVSGLSTMTNAILASGGIKKIGSLRRIELKRGGRLISVLDLYDLLLHGDTSHDVQLMPGDVIFIPPIGNTVSVYGAVRRPAIYELKKEKSAEQVIQVAGGLLPDADGKLVQLEQIAPSRLHQMRNVDLSTETGRNAEVSNGDKLHVLLIRPTLENSVVLTGYVFRPGSLEFHTGMRLSDVLPSFDELRPNADRHYIMIRREVPPVERVEVISADLERALTARGSSADPVLSPRDKIFVFSLTASRERIVAPVIKDLELQGTPEKPAQIVSIDGKVNDPGRYPLEPAMRISDLIRAGGSMDDSAYEGEAELTRYEVQGGDARQTALVPVDLAAIRRGDHGADLPLQPYDTLIIKVTPQWDEPGTIEVAGEVRFPGTYPIHRGETISSVLRRAGGVTDLAFVEGAVFIRDELKQREKDQLELLTTRLQSDLAALSLEAITSSAATANSNGANNATQGLEIGQQLVAQLRDSKPVGRLVIDLKRVSSGVVGGPGDVIARNGDKLLIPKQTQEITILGEVQSPTSHVYRPGLTRDEYIAKSGGTTQKADRKRIYIVRANGDVVTGQRSGWFRRTQQTTILPGDTIVVPLDTERVRALPLWQAVTTIVYNLAVALLAVRSVNH